MADCCCAGGGAMGRSSLVGGDVDLGEVVEGWCAAAGARGEEALAAARAAALPLGDDFGELDAGLGVIEREPRGAWARSRRDPAVISPRSRREMSGAWPSDEAERFPSRRAPAGGKTAVPSGSSTG